MGIRVDIGWGGASRRVGRPFEETTVVGLRMFSLTLEYHRSIPHFGTA